MSPASIIRQFLIDQNLGTASGAWPISVSLLNDTPDNAIGVYDTAGENDGRIQRTGERIVRPGIQVLIRGITYPDTITKARAIAMTLDSAHNVLVGTSPLLYQVQNISRRGDILSLGAETVNNRSRFSFTVNAVIIYSLKG